MLQEIAIKYLPWLPPKKCVIQGSGWQSCPNTFLQILVVFLASQNDSAQSYAHFFPLLAPRYGGDLTEASPSGGMRTRPLPAGSNLWNGIGPKDSNKLPPQNACQQFTYPVPVYINTNMYICLMCITYFKENT